ncbi:MAG: hypothetical protein ACI9TH_000717 [Kiritimatiellia bacterium]|jgi:hypothetical protein
MSIFSALSANRRDWAAYGLLFGVLTLWQVQILTYVSAQDSSQIYIPMAWDLIDADWSLDSIKTVSERISPGWPILLSGVIKVFGRYAPYWVNLVFCFGFFVLLSQLLYRSLGSWLDTFVIVLLSLLLLLTGTALNPHYLLYAFRDLPTMFFILAAWYLMTISRWKGSMLFAGACWVLAMALKEVAVGALPAFAWYGFRFRRKQLFGFFLPLLAVGLLGVCFSQSAGLAFTQPRRVIASLLASPMEKVQALAHLLLSLTRYLLVLGWVCFLPGCRAALRKPALAGLLGIGLGIGALYVAGVPRYALHDRYILSVLMWMLPFVGLGLLQLLKPLSLKHPSWRCRELLLIVCGMLLVGLSFLTISWDTHVSRVEIRTFRNVIKQHIPKDGWVVISPAYRMASGALDGFTRTRRADPYGFQPQMDAGEAVFMIDSRDEGALHPNSKAQWALSPRESVLAEYDLQQLAEVDLAGYVYRLKRIRPRTQTRREIVFQPPRRVQPLLWLDLRNTAPATLTWEGVGEYHLERKLQCLIMPEAMDAYPIRWTLESEKGLPERVVHRKEPLDSKSVWSLEQRFRSLSGLAWFEPPFIHLAPAFYYGVACHTGGLFRVPLPLNVEVQSVQVDFSWKWKTPMQLEIWRDDERLYRGSANEDGVEGTQLEIKGPFAQEPELRFVLTDVANPRDLLYLSELKLRYVVDHGN